jgi:hypothetical protein
MNEKVTYEEAKERVQQLKGFYQHLVVYVLVNVFLFVINVVTSPDNWWFYWPLLGWGIGIVAHGAAVFFGGGLWGKAWEEKKIRKLMGDRGSKDDLPEA